MLPKGWVIKHLNDVFPVIDSLHQTPVFSETGYPMVRVADIKGANLSLIDVAKVSEETFKVYTKKYLPKKGDIIFSRVGSYGNSSYVSTNKLFCLGQNTVIAKSMLNADSYYIFQFLNSSYVKIQVDKMVDGSSHKTVSLKVIRELKILLPPICEQNKIAKILSAWDKAITTTEQLLANSQQQKKALMQQLLTGKRHFLGFNSEWKFAKFDKLFIMVNDKKTQVKSSEYLDTGSVPIVDQGQHFTAGYTNKKEIYSATPVIVFGDHTRIVKWIDFVFAPGADGTQLIRTKPLIEIKLGYYLIAGADIPNLGYSRHMRELKKQDFKYSTDSKEQQKIAFVLTTNDKEIETLKMKLDSLKQEKKALMQQLLTGKRRVVAKK